MASTLQKYLRSEYSHPVHGGVPSLLAVVSSPTQRPTRVHGSARSIFRDHPPHYRPKLNCPLQATLAMQCDRCEVSGPPGGRDYVATRPTCGPLLILSTALKRWESPSWQWLCSHPAHLLGTSHFVPRFEAYGIPKASGFMTPPCPLVGHL